MRPENRPEIRLLGRRVLLREPVSVLRAPLDPVTPESMACGSNAARALLPPHHVCQEKQTNKGIVWMGWGGADRSFGSEVGRTVMSSICSCLLSGQGWFVSWERCREKE